MFASDAHLTIGALEKDDGTLTSFFDGKMDEVRIWNVYRTQAQINDWMNTTINLNAQSGLVSVWHFDESTVGTKSAIDSKGSNDGTPTNMNNSDCVASTAPINITPLPVNLLDFSAHFKGQNNVELIWATASEINNSHFEIQQSIDAENFKTIGIIEGTGNSNIIHNYNFVLENDEEFITYYRLKQIDFDGKYSFSEIISINPNQTNLENIEIYPNPFANEISINFNTQLTSITRVEIRNSVGVLIREKEIDINNSNFKIELNEELSAGIYFMVISNDKETIVRKLIKE